jgi:HPt (histidine-containing phosphotransfer) domain-containing protein
MAIKNSSIKNEPHLIQDFNIKMVREFTHNNDEFIVSTLHLLSEALIDEQKNLSTALINNDLEILKFITHRIKSNFHLLGLKNLGELCDEVAKKDTSLDEVKELCASIVKSIPYLLGKIELQGGKKTKERKMLLI